MEAYCNPVHAIPSAKTESLSQYVSNGIAWAHNQFAHPGAQNIKKRAHVLSCMSEPWPQPCIGEASIPTKGSWNLSHIIQSAVCTSSCNCVFLLALPSALHYASAPNTEEAAMVVDEKPSKVCASAAFMPNAGTGISAYCLQSKLLGKSIPARAYVMPRNQQTSLQGSKQPDIRLSRLERAYLCKLPARRLPACLKCSQTAFLHAYVMPCNKHHCAAQSMPRLCAASSLTPGSSGSTGAICSPAGASAGVWRPEGHSRHSQGEGGRSVRL